MRLLAISSTDIKLLTEIVVCLNNLPCSFLRYAFELSAQMIDFVRVILGKEFTVSALHICRSKYGTQSEDTRVLLLFAL
jgi:hypothetical protein